MHIHGIFNKILKLHVSIIFLKLQYQLEKITEEFVPDYYALLFNI